MSVDTRLMAYNRDIYKFYYKNPMYVKMALENANRLHRGEVPWEVLTGVKSVTVQELACNKIRAEGEIVFSLDPRVVMRTTVRKNFLEYHRSRNDQRHLLDQNVQVEEMTVMEPCPEAAVIAESNISTFAPAMEEDDTVHEVIICPTPVRISSNQMSLINLATLNGMDPTSITTIPDTEAEFPPAATVTGFQHNSLMAKNTQVNTSTCKYFFGSFALEGQSEFYEQINASLRPSVVVGFKIATDKV